MRLEILRLFKFLHNLDVLIIGSITMLLIFIIIIMIIIIMQPV